MARTGLTGRRITVPKNTTKRVTSSQPKKEKTFKEAFAEARKKHGGGGGTFTWRNKKYTTDYKSEKKKPTPPPIPKEKPTPPPITGGKPRQKKSLRGYSATTTTTKKPGTARYGGKKLVRKVTTPTNKPTPTNKTTTNNKTTTAITKSQIQKDREQAIKDAVAGLWTKFKKGFAPGSQKSARRAGGGVIIHIGAGKALRGHGKVRRRKGGKIY